MEKGERLAAGGWIEEGVQEVGCDEHQDDEQFGDVHGDVYVGNNHGLDDEVYADGRMTKECILAPLAHDKEVPEIKKIVY